jgi:formylglycine-generating enzyme required for sulfatase activity
MMILSILAATFMTAACVTTVNRMDDPDVPAMVRIEPGHFIAGSTPEETDAVHYPALNAAREHPAREVTIAHAYAIGRTEITRGQFARFVRATHWQPDGPCSFLPDQFGAKWTSDAAHDWLHPGFVQDDNHPVVCVNLADARAYAAWLGTMTGRHFRLPSNVEWEYAARAGTTTAHWWDNRADRSNPCAFANLSDISRARKNNHGIVDPSGYFACNDGYATTAPVASFLPNPWGLYDMLGNVWEWTEDCLNADQIGAPTDTRARVGDCASHMDRGSSWGNSPKYVRAAAQHPDLVGARTSVLGFRLVEDLP